MSHKKVFGKTVSAVKNTFAGMRWAKTLASEASGAKLNRREASIWVVLFEGQLLGCNFSTRHR